jgi:hypothetical protein
VFSKNSASSRAIPIEKFIKVVQDNPVLPIWTENQKGMQGPPITDEAQLDVLNSIWMEGRDSAVDYAQQLEGALAHKQNINRILEPWFHIKIVLTGTEFDNWFLLRDHPDAQPEIQELARVMKREYEISVPNLLAPGQWHVPFGDNIDEMELRSSVGLIMSMNTSERRYGVEHLKISVARCARVSYNNFDGTSDPIKDIELYEKLVVAEPLHASPAEHQARVPTMEEVRGRHLDSSWFSSITSYPLEDRPDEWDAIHRHGKYMSNLYGWIQLRKLIECGEFA